MNTLKTVIVGAGLSGLVSIIEFFKQARENPSTLFELSIIEKRNLDFNRRQKLVICKKPDLGFYSRYPVITWDNYCKDLFDPWNELSLNDQKMLQHRSKNILPNIALNKREKLIRKLARQEDFAIHPITQRRVLKNFSIKALQFALLEHIRQLQAEIPNVSLKWFENSAVSSINFDKKLIEIDLGNNMDPQKNKDKQKQLLEFDHILNCEGSKGETTHLIQSALPSKEQENLQFQNYTFPTLYHCAVRLRLKSIPNQSRSSLQFFNNPSQQISEASLLEKFKTLGYNSNELPALFIIDDNFYKSTIESDEFQLRLFIASEIPQCLHEINDINLRRQAIIKWVCLIASMQYGIPENCFEFDNKGETLNHRINALTFANELKYVNHPALQLENGVKIFLIGDANKSNFYPAGFSSSFIPSEVQEAVKLICKPKLPCSSFNNQYAFYKNYLRDELEGMSHVLQRNFNAEYESQQCKK